MFPGRQKEQGNKQGRAKEKVRRMNAAQLDIGKSARVILLKDNNEITSKIVAMGVIPGSVITKKSSIPAKGPVILEKDLVQFAVSYETAQKIIVEPLENESGSGL